MSTEQSPDPNGSPDSKLSEEAHRVATEAVDAVEAFAHAAVNLPADTAKLALDAILAAVAKANSVINRVTR